MFAVIAVIGPVLHYAERRRAREAVNFQVTRWAHVVALNTPAPRFRVPFAPEPETRRRPAPMPLRQPDQTERLTQVLQQLVDRMQMDRPPGPSAVTRPARRAGIEMMTSAR